MDENVKNLLDKAWAAYAVGSPFMSDAEFDVLAKRIGYAELIGSTYEVQKRAKHTYKMHSQQKVYDDEPAPLHGKLIETPKLDGAAVSLTYTDGVLTQGRTRGDGIEGEDITDKVYLLPSIPKTFEHLGIFQISGELLCQKDIPNARNFASGSLNIKDIEEFISDKVEYLTFVAYDIKPTITSTYKEDMIGLGSSQFFTVLQPYLEDHFRTDGKVFRLDNNADYKAVGYTSKHPKGAYARKLTSAVEIVETTLLECRWQVGRTGKVTPVAIFENVVIDDANITQATLHNPGFIEDMQLDIGDTILVTRSGGIIPKVLGKL